MRIYQKFLAVIALSGLCFAPAVASENAGAVKKGKKPARAEAEAKPPCEACEAIKRLEDKLAAQQAEIDAQRAEINALKAAQQQPAAGADEQARAAAAAQQQAAEAAAAAAEAKAKAEAAAAQNEELKKGLEEATTTAHNAEKKARELDTPGYIHYKNVRLTPGGYLAAEGVWRQRTLSNDTYSNFNQLPFPNDSRYDLTEFRGSARASRISLLAEGAAKDTKLTGYVEIDFEGAAPTANENLTSSFNPRMRQAFGQASWHGWTVSGGQSWSLLTLSKSGIKLRDEWIPSTIEGDYVPGYTYLRAMNMRVAKTLADGRATAAFAIENPATLVAGTGAAAVSGGTGGPGGTITGGPGNTNLDNGKNFTANLAPDLEAKVAFDPSFGHIEVKAVGRFFRDRIIGGDNNMELGGGIGAGIIVPVMNKKVSLIADAMFGRGIARYGAAGNLVGADITIFSDGSIHPLQELHGLGGIEVHVAPKLDWYLYGGEDYIGRDHDATAGYGNPAAAIGTCGVPDHGFSLPATSAFACNANTKSIIQGTTGFWYNIYKGGYGTLRYGTQYSWTYKSTWAGVDSVVGLTAPKTSDNMVFTSFRYIIP